MRNHNLNHPTLFASVLIGLGAFQPAYADAASTKETVLFNLRGILFTEKHCRDLVADRERLAKLLDAATEAGVDPNEEGAMADEVEKDDDDLQAQYDDVGNTSFCKDAYRMYGPDDTGPGIIKKR